MTSLAVPSCIKGMKFPADFDLQKRVLERLKLISQKAPNNGRIFRVTQDEYDTVVDVFGKPKLYGFDLVVGMQKYRCHKEVVAAKIIAARLNGIPPQYTLKFEDGSEHSMLAGKFLDDPVGGYYVRYADGYESWSPAEAFEEGYTLV